MRAQLDAWLAKLAVLLPWMGLISIATLVATLLVLPYFLAQIPGDYFIKEEYRHHCPGLPQVLCTALRVLKNGLGLILVVAGVVMVFLPGPGLMTILIGLILTDFPGKRALEVRLVTQPGVFVAVNYLRHRVGHAPLTPPASLNDGKRVRD